MFVERLDPQPAGSYLPAFCLVVSKEAWPGAGSQGKSITDFLFLRSHEARGCLSYPSSAFCGPGVPRALGAGSGRPLSYLPGESTAQEHGYSCP